MDAYAKVKEEAADSGGENVGLRACMSFEKCKSRAQCVHVAHIKCVNVTHTVRGCYS